MIEHIAWLIECAKYSQSAQVHQYMVIDLQRQCVTPRLSIRIQAIVIITPEAKVDAREQPISAQLVDRWPEQSRALRLGSFRQTVLAGMLQTLEYHCYDLLRQAVRSCVMICDVLP
jgi:hypothetical protein